MYQAGWKLNEIARMLNRHNIAAANGGRWYATTVSGILVQAGLHKRWSRPRIDRVCDPAVSAARARELHAQGYSLRQIAERLTAERHVPQRAGAWHPATVRSLLARPSGEARQSAAEVARALRDGGASLRHIGRTLSEQGYVPPRGGRWHAATVMHLLSPM